MTLKLPHSPTWPAKIIVMAIVLTSLTLGHAQSTGPDPEDAVIAKYRSSTDLPDRVAYKMFLISVEGLQDRTDDHPDHVMSDAFGLDLDTEAGVKTAKERLSWFATSASEARQESRAEVRRVLCPRGWSEMTFEQISKVRFESEAARGQVYDDYYQAAFAYLPKNEHEPFRSYIIGIKKRTSHVEFDPAVHFGDDAEREAFEYQAAVCAEDPNLTN